MYFAYGAEAMTHAVERPPRRVAISALIDALKVPLPEKTFVQAHTGGAANGAITSLPRKVLKEVKRAWEQKP